MADTAELFPQIFDGDLTEISDDDMLKALTPPVGYPLVARIRTRVLRKYYCDFPIDLRTMVNTKLDLLRFEM
jgi:hypothetical protein